MKKQRTVVTQPPGRTPGTRGTRRVKQIDVADLAGVTRATVSRVLNNYTDKFSVRPEVRQRVLDAAASLGYRPNLLAHTLRKKTNSGIVGWFGAMHPVSFSSNVLDVLTDALSHHDLLLSPIYATDAKEPIKLPWWRMDAAVVSGINNQGEVQSLETADIPYVCVNCICGPRGSSVQMDDAGGMRAACEHLLGLGHRRIAYAIRGPAYMGEHPSVHARREAFVEIMRDADATSLMTEDKCFVEDADAYVREMVVRQRATAIVAYSCHTAILLIRSLQKAGLRIPRDVSLVAFNDEYPLPYLHPAVTVVDLNGRAAGRIAAEMVVAHLDDPSLEPMHQIIPERLIVRESTATPKLVRSGKRGVRGVGRGSAPDPGLTEVRGER
ncbi:MAG: LacI family DNA-binding transcriptional regulator [Kiritimatiellia bacterium]|jgi:LacI family transcriptional regulator